MAGAYHQEALRKQRVIDRAYQARLKLDPSLKEEDSDEEIMAMYTNPNVPDPDFSCDFRRTPSAGSRASGSRASGSRDSQTRDTHSAQASRHSQRGSAQSSRSASATGSRHSSRTSSRSSNSRPASATAAATSVRRLSEEDILKLDLHKKELLLRDSNLTMGHISPRELVRDLV